MSFPLGDILGQSYLYSIAHFAQGGFRMNVVVERKFSTYLCKEQCPDHLYLCK